MRNYKIVETRGEEKSIDLRISIGENATKGEIKEIAEYITNIEFKDKNQILIMFFKDEEHAKRKNFKRDYRYATYYFIRKTVVGPRKDWRWDF